MTYEEAIAQAKAGNSIKRSGWVKVTAEFIGGELWFVDSQGCKSGRFVPTNEELYAKDWMVVE